MGSTPDQTQIWIFIDSNLYPLSVPFPTQNQIKLELKKITFNNDYLLLLIYNVCKIIIQTP